MKLVNPDTPTHPLTAERHDDGTMTIRLGDVNITAVGITLSQEFALLLAQPLDLMREEGHRSCSASFMAGAPVRFSGSSAVFVGVGSLLSRCGSKKTAEAGL